MSTPTADGQAPGTGSANGRGDPAMPPQPSETGDVIDESVPHQRMGEAHRRVADVEEPREKSGVEAVEDDVGIDLGGLQQNVEVDVPADQCCQAQHRYRDVG